MIEVRGWPLGGCVTIQSLYHDKRAVWLRACHDTIGCIVTGGQRLSHWVVSRYKRDKAGGSAAIRRRERAGARATQRRYG